MITITLHFIVFPESLEGGGIVDAFGPRRGWVDELFGTAQRPPPNACLKVEWTLISSEVVQLPSLRSPFPLKGLR